MKPFTSFGEKVVDTPLGVRLPLSGADARQENCACAHWRSGACFLGPTELEDWKRACSCNRVSTTSRSRIDLQAHRGSQIWFKTMRKSGMLGSTISVRAWQSKQHGWGHGVLVPLRVPVPLTATTGQNHNFFFKLNFWLLSEARSTSLQERGIHHGLADSFAVLKIHFAYSTSKECKSSMPSNFSEDTLTLVPCTL